MLYLIYKHTSPSGKSYIGITNDYNVRCTDHKSGNNGCTAFAAAVKKYGWDNFTHEIIIADITKEEAVELEPLLIESHHTRAPYGYNLSSGGECWTHSEESKAKMSASRTGIKQSDETKAKKSAALKGRPRPEHVVEALRQANTGRKWTEEQRAAASLARKGKPAPEGRGRGKYEWVLTSPDGIEYNVFGLAEFCATHHLQVNALCRVANGTRKHHKGWTARKVTPAKDAISHAEALPTTAYNI